MDFYSSEISKLIEELSQLPGIGAKTAQRLAFHIINMPKEQAKSLSDAIIDAKEHVRYCKCCYTLTDDELCPICKDVARDHKTYHRGYVAVVLYQLGGRPPVMDLPVFLRDAPRVLCGAQQEAARSDRTA